MGEGYWTPPSYADLALVTHSKKGTTKDPTPVASPKIQEKVFIDENYGISSLNRSSFPHGFIFGAASSSYQYEGAANEGGRKPSLWDTYTHKHPERIDDHSTGDVAIDSYHKYKIDVQYLKDMNMDAYRISIAWPRIIPTGKLKDGVNKEGIQYYNDLINELLAQGKIPFVTIFHWDIPQPLEDEYSGFLSPLVVRDFVDYVDICFKEFGDRVKHWITLNEAWTFAVNGYAAGILAPGRCSPFVSNCTGGNSATEPYMVMHNQLLAHGAAVKLYRDKYQEYQKGTIGITNVCHWFEPLTKSKRDLEASEVALDFMCGWVMDPLVNGDYPKSMRRLVGSRLPRFTKVQSDLVKGSFNFIGLNYYTANYATFSSKVNNNGLLSYTTDARVNQTCKYIVYIFLLLTHIHNIEQTFYDTASVWLYVYPKGIRNILLYIKNKYNNPLIYITENEFLRPKRAVFTGVDEFNNATIPLKEALQDEHRITFYNSHFFYLKQAIEKGSNVKGYFAWSLMDNFEWNSGYTVRFGINYVDYKDNNKRYPKISSKWFTKFLAK
ncbi:beta-glucosidase 12-like [Impatiens glandulifera]|uniref:beta-glucosidase 12-like n=1 Tax=Impatiens glandulifera TaxID=253017 RepID=UPI001FB08409|nr:beta-glucosidase 12-like [Impatiens glandulifera]